MLKLYHIIYVLVPERSKGAGLRSAAYSFMGSNPIEYKYYYFFVYCKKVKN